MILFLCIHSNSVLCVLSLFPQVKDKHRRHRGHSGISGRKYIYIHTFFCVVCMVRLIFAKGMNNRNTFVFVLCVPRFAIDVPFNGCVFNITPQRASDDDNPPVCFLMFNDYIQQTQRSFIFCSAQPVES